MGGLITGFSARSDDKLPVHNKERLGPAIFSLQTRNCAARMRVGVRPSSPDQSLTLPELRPTFGRKLLDRERGSARHCGLNLLAHLSLGRSGTPLRGGSVLFRHAASLSGMSQLTACAISTSQGTRSGSGRGMRPSDNALALQSCRESRP